MDILTVVGLVVAFGGIIGGMLAEGGHIQSLLNLPAFIIVFGGTIGAVLIQMPMDAFKRALGRSKWAIMPPKVPMQETIEKIVGWSNIARKEGLLRLEDQIQQEPDPFRIQGVATAGGWQGARGNPPYPGDGSGNPRRNRHAGDGFL
jgi:chemotaxis protein MotA